MLDKRENDDNDYFLSVYEHIFLQRKVLFFKITKDTRSNKRYSLKIIHTREINYEIRRMCWYQEL